MLLCLPGVTAMVNGNLVGLTSVKSYGYCCQSALAEFF